MLLILTCLVQIIVATTAVRPKQVNLALETVFNFDKTNVDLKLINSVHDFISKLKDAVSKSPSRRNYYNESLKFTDFIKKLIKILQNYNDHDLEYLFVVLDGEIRKYHYKGCKFHELLQGDFRRYVAEKLDSVKGKTAKDIRKILNKTLNVIDNAKYDSSQMKILEYVDSLYGKEDANKMVKVLERFKTHNSFKRSNDGFIDLVRGGLRSVLFDHFSKLNTNIRTDFKIKLDTFSKDIDRKKNRHLSFEYRSNDAKYSKEDNVDDRLKSNIDKVKENNGVDKKLKYKGRSNNNRSDNVDKSNDSDRSDVDSVDTNSDDDDKVENIHEDDDKSDIINTNKSKKHWVSDKSDQQDESTETSKESNLSISNQKYMKDSIEIIKNKNRKKSVFIGVKQQEKSVRKLQTSTTKRPKYSFITLYPEEIKLTTKKKRFQVKSSSKSEETQLTEEKVSSEESEITKEVTENIFSRKQQKLLSTKREIKQKRLGKKLQTIWPEELPQIKYRAKEPEFVISHNMEINVGNGKTSYQPKFSSRYIKKPREDTKESFEKDLNAESKDISKSEDSKEFREDESEESKPTEARLRLHFTSQKRNNVSDEFNEGTPINNHENRRNIANKRKLVKETNEKFTKNIKKVSHYSRRAYKKLHFWDGTQKEIIVNSTTNKAKAIVSYENKLTTKSMLDKNNIKIISTIHNDKNAKVTNDKYIKKDATEMLKTKINKSLTTKVNVENISAKDISTTVNKIVKSDELKPKSDIFNEIDGNIANLNYIQRTHDNSMDDPEYNAIVKAVKNNLVTHLPKNHSIEENDYNKVIDKWQKNLDNFYDMSADNITTRKPLHMVTGKDEKEKNLKDKLQGLETRRYFNEELEAKSEKLLEKIHNMASKKEVTAIKMAKTKINNLRDKKDLELSRTQSKTEPTMTSFKTTVSIETEKTSKSTPKLVEFKNMETKDDPKNGDNTLNVLSSENTVILENTPDTTSTTINLKNTTKSEKELDKDLHDLLRNYGVTLPKTDINPEEFVKTSNKLDKEELIKNKLQEDFAKILKDLPDGRRAGNIELETEFPDPFMDLKDVP